MGRDWDSYGREVGSLSNNELLPLFLEFLREHDNDIDELWQWFFDRTDLDVFEVLEPDDLEKLAHQAMPEDPLAAMAWIEGAGTGP
jgi:hypothetical protein